MVAMRRLWILGALLGLLAGGCGSKYAGHYEGSQPQPNAPENMQSTVGAIKLELKENGRFVYQRLSMPWEGEWAQEDGNIKLKIDSALNRPVETGSALTPKDVVLTPLKDGSLSLKDSFTGPSESVVLKPIKP
jgi:hypothetical protein